MIIFFIFKYSLLLFLFLFFISLLGIFVFRKHLINVLIAIEMLLLSISCLFIIFGLYLKDIIGEIFAMYILTVAAAESSIALALLCVYYRISGHLTIDLLTYIKA